MINIDKVNQFLKYFRKIISSINEEERNLLRKKNYNITVRELRYISIIHENSGRSIKEILPYTGVTKSTFSNQIKFLIQKRFVILKISKVDRRVKEVFLAKKGEEVYKLILSLKEKLVEELQTAITSEEFVTLIDILKKMAAIS